MQGDAVSGDTPQRGPVLDHPPALARSIEPQDAPLPRSRKQEDLAVPFPSGEGLYPEDFYIGSLEKSPESLTEAENAARSWLRAYLSGGPRQSYQSKSFSRPFTDLQNELKDIRFDAFRLAAGMALDGDSVSFLLRLKGSTHSASAELIVARIDGLWLVDDIILDEDLVERGQERRFDPFTYTRFL